MSQILITKYKTGVDFPPLRTGLTHLAARTLSLFRTRLVMLKIASVTTVVFIYV